jgi:transposase
MEARSDAVVTGNEKLTQIGNMNLPHRRRCLLHTEVRMELAVLRKHGTSIRELAHVRGWSRKTVRRYLHGGKATAARKAAPKRAEKPDAFKPYIVERLAAAAPDRIPSAVLSERPVV